MIDGKVGATDHFGLADVLVNFYLQQRFPMAYDITDQQGRYFLLSGASNGVLPGGYRVAVSGPKNSGIPEQYGMTGTSGLEFEVAPGKNKIDITLE